ncbi:arylsulfatase precursor [Dothidotthia symphoricarpi CBS 119687]|uniref:Arylsulfatase n=1 Tax=Dothidotthia symphoricarpi CBS 119687 TaxID=1392245 RepID=A0A6A5ZZ09_9PLEO|nr:arylsulfatase precursor [Dothidotthia symphoricarpi CBS 119687]KAF2124799.1 arylsulfatase precursor [Dothidotthia symphoricarpi CBS 119687]
MIASQLLLPLAASFSVATGRSSTPNFIFIMTDDQDMHLNSLDYQKSVQKHFAQEGTWFKKHFCTVSLCCPSRVSLLTGKAAHNTNVTDVSAPYGGYPKFIAEGFNDNYLPVWLQAAGFNTYYSGKMMNGFSTSTYNNPRIQGWNGSDFLVDPGTYIFYNSTMVRNNGTHKNYPGEYSTDLVAAAAVGFLDEAIAASDRPFFLGVAPISPHSETITNPRPTKFNPPVPAKRHEHLFPNVTIPRTPNFNPDTPGTASYFKTIRQLNQSEIEYNDNWYRRRLQSLQSVDELIDSIMERLSASPEVLENTYLIYTSDNGFHIGQHRLPPGKSCNIEEDVNIPFFIRGPGVAKGAVQTIPSSHTDIVPTIFSLAGIPLRDDFDGEVIPVTDDLLASSEKSEHVNIEFWGEYLVEGNTFFGQDYFPNNTYKHVRVIGEEYDLAYAVWCTNEHELYDMTNDPYQLHNVYNTNGTVNGWSIERLSSRLNGLLLTLKRCKGHACTRPWEKLYPAGDVQNLKDAMDERYDVFYLEHQPPVSFSECALGQILSVEGALEPVVWQAEWDAWSLST